MYVSQIDAPSDVVGAVSDVSRPLIHKLNQATMQRGTYDALRTLLVWALATLEDGIEDALDTFEAHELAQHARDKEPVAHGDRTTESSARAITGLTRPNDTTEEPKPAVEPEKGIAEPIAPLDPAQVEDSAEDAALEAEIAQVEAAPVAVEPAVEAPKAVKVAKPK